MLFHFDKDFYKWKFRLLIGSSLTSVFANLFLEFRDWFPSKIFYQYDLHISDILIICPINQYDLVIKLNIEFTIEFTYETEPNSTLPFVNIMLSYTGVTLLSPLDQH